MATKKNSKSKTTPKSSSRNGKRDAISLLKEDHKLVKDLLQKLVTSSSSDRASKSADGLLSRIEQEIKTHSKVEEQIFYPAYKECARKKDDQELFYEAREEHHIVDVVLEEFREAEDHETFAAKCKLLKELVEHHIKEEEGDMFPKAKKSMGADMLRELGEQIEGKKQEIMSEAS